MNSPSCVCITVCISIDIIIRIYYKYSLMKPNYCVTQIDILATNN